MTVLEPLFVGQKFDSHNLIAKKYYGTSHSGQPNKKFRRKQVDKLRALKFSLHFFSTYGTNRRAWYLLTNCLSFVSPKPIDIISYTP